ncbi:hypothetical protein ALQ67_200067 [Pseudomonas savastanoi pv. glycinea]|nr:hypothetical protein ALQ67_200067 [Pseudomonas savastanoi pv. glycinea]
MLARRGFSNTANQAHAHGTVGANGFQTGKRLRITIDIALQLGTAVAYVGGVDENCRDTGVDHGCFQGADAGHFKVVYQVAGGKHRAACALFVRCRIKKLQRHLRGRKGHAVQFEIAGFLYLAVADGHMGDDGLADIGLPDTHDDDAVLRHTTSIEQTTGDSKRADGRRQVAAIAAPVDERLVDGYLAEQVIDIVVGLGAARHNDRFAGTGRRPAHAVDLLFIGVRAADDSQQQRIPRRSRNLCSFGQVRQPEKHTLAGATTHVGGGDADLG